MKPYTISTLIKVTRSDQVAQDKALKAEREEKRLAKMLKKEGVTLEQIKQLSAGMQEDKEKPTEEKPGKGRGRGTRKGKGKGKGKGRKSNESKAAEDEAEEDAVMEQRYAVLRGETAVVEAMVSDGGTGGSSDVLASKRDRTNLQPGSASGGKKKRARGGRKRLMTPRALSQEFGAAAEEEHVTTPSPASKGGAPQTPEPPVAAPKAKAKAKGRAKAVAKPAAGSGRRKRMTKHDFPQIDLGNFNRYRLMPYWNRGACSLAAHTSTKEAGGSGLESACMLHYSYIYIHIYRDVL